MGYTTFQFQQFLSFVLLVVLVRYFAKSMGIRAEQRVEQKTGKTGGKEEDGAGAAENQA